MNTECPICGNGVNDVHPFLGDAWDHCESCRDHIVDSKSQDYAINCPRCNKDLDYAHCLGEYRIKPSHLDLVFKCDCGCHSRYPKNKKTLLKTIKEGITSRPDQIVIEELANGETEREIERATDLASRLL